MHQPTPLHGAIDVATAALAGGLATIEGVHDAIARKPFAALRVAPVVGEVSEAVRVIQDGVTGLVYAGIGAAIAVTGDAARFAATFAAAPDTELRAGSASDLAVAALNGFDGERLERTGNPLATKMSLRHAGQTVSLERDALAAAFPAAAPRLAVFVHGLAGNETLWTRRAQQHYGNPQTTYGSRLESDLGYTALYVRYNTGLHISNNGRQLARLLDRLVAQWPVPVDEVVLVGHSMGGLVMRSALHCGNCDNRDWVRHVRHLFFLGSPHLGAPLEKAVNVTAWVLGRIDVTRPFAAALNARSVGIKDLRFGTLRDEDWQGVDLDALLANRAADVPLLESAAHYCIAATVTRDPRHPLGVMVGDLLVREASARGRRQRSQFPTENSRHFGALNHLDLLNHPDVYDQIRRWLRESTAAARSHEPPARRP